MKSAREKKSATPSFFLKIKPRGFCSSSPLTPLPIQLSLLLPCAHLAYAVLGAGWLALLRIDYRSLAHWHFQLAAQGNQCNQGKWALR